MRFSPPALLVIQTTWLGITGRREVCQEIAIDKFKLFQQSPDNLKECQLEPEEIPEEDMDKEEVEPFVDPKDSRARINHIQCKSDILSPEDIEEAAIYKDKDGDWGIGMPPVDLRPSQQDEVEGGHLGPPTIVLGGRSPITSREESEEAQEDGRSPYQEMEGGDRSVAQQTEQEEVVQRPKTVPTAKHPGESQ